MANQSTRIESFSKAHPHVWAWLETESDGFEFARSLRHAVMQYGDLTPKQLAAAEKCAVRKAVKVAEVAQAAPQAFADVDLSEMFGIEIAAPATHAPKAPTIKTDKLTAAFDTAKANGLKRPILRFDGFQASLAPATGRNPGAVYIKVAGEYAGKISKGGEFSPSRDCPNGLRAKIEAAMADPLAAAVAYGCRIGSCSCCGRTLTDPESIRRGIGPICAENFGL